MIHVEKWGPLVLGKTCRYCARCELIIVHQDELEGELTISMAKLAPEAIGSDYLVLGTMDKKIWQQGIKGSRPPRPDLGKYMANFKKHLDLQAEGGWRPA